MIAGRRVKIGLDGMQQRGHLFHLQDAREATREAWRGDGAPWVTWRKIAPGGPAVERPDGGQSLSDR